MEFITCYVNQPTVNGCDSIIVVDLILNYTAYHYDTITVCGEFYWYADTITQSVLIHKYFGSMFQQLV